MSRIKRKVMQHENYLKDSNVDNVRSVNDFSCDTVSGGCLRSIRMALKKEDGFMEIQFLIIYMVVLLTMFFFIFGHFLGVYKEANAKYLYLQESMEFAVEASNVTGNISEVTLNESLVREYFVLAMDRTIKDYTLKEFTAVEKGGNIPGGTAKSPGYMAEVKVPVFEGEIGMLGHQEVTIPMSYFAVAESGQIK